MRKRRLGVMSILVTMSLVLVTTPALAGRWSLGLAGGYGNYSLNWEKPNEFAEEFNSWIRSTLGISGFKIKQMEEDAPLYSAGLKLESPSSRWELALDLNYRKWDMNIEQKSITILEGGAEKYVWAIGSLSGGTAFGDLIVYRKFPQSVLVPFLGVGATYCAAGTHGDCNVFQETFSPYELKSLYESFEASDFLWGRVLALGIESKGKNIRIRLEARYHQIPKIEGKFEVENQGFSTLPVDPHPFKVDVSGLSVRVYLMFYL